jgi:hypothetical protein
VRSVRASVVVGPLLLATLQAAWRGVQLIAHRTVRRAALLTRGRKCRPADTGGDDFN